MSSCYIQPILLPIMSIHLRLSCSSRSYFQFGLNIFESYYDIEVDTQVLSQLPDNGTVIDCITAEEIDKPHSNSNVGTEVDADTDDEEPSPIVTTVPNLLPE